MKVKLLNKVSLKRLKVNVQLVFFDFHTLHSGFKRKYNICYLIFLLNSLGKGKNLTLLCNTMKSVFFQFFVSLKEKIEKWTTNFFKSSL